MWFSKRKTVSDTPVPAPGPVSTERDSAVPVRQIHLAFTGMLVGAPGIEDRAMTPTQADALRSLAQTAKAPGIMDLLPRLPAALPRLMGLISKENTSAAELADQLSTDPVMLGEVIRLANSPYYRSPRPIHSVTDAVQVLGQIGLQQLVARVALRPVFGAQSGRWSKAASIPLWGLAKRCAHGSAWLRGHWGDPFEGYLAGMAATAGMIAVLRLLDRSAGFDVAPSSADFLDGLRRTGLALNAPLARAWSFPPSVIAALEALAQENVSGDATLAANVHCANWIAMSLLLPADGALSVPAFATEEPATACRSELMRSFAPAQSI